VLAGGRNRVVVDMTFVEYVSSGGWGVFTERLREVRRAGGDIKLFGMDPDVYYVFTMLGFNIVLASFDMFAETIDDFRRVAAPVADDAPSAAVAEAVPGRSVAGTPGMDLEWSDDDGVRVATLAGVVETTAVSLLTDELSRELARAPRAIVFDLAQVEYISSSGWGQFARAFEATGAVALAGMGADLADVFACLEFRSFISAFATRAEAVAAMRDRRPVERVASPPPAPPTPAADDTHTEGLDDVLGERPGPKAQPSRDTPSVRPARDGSAPPEGAEEPLVFGRRNFDDAGGMRGDAAAPDDLDVDSAVADRNVDRDRKLRALGWEKYGEQLRERGGSEKEHPADGDEDEDTV
jgi:anti-anti-sigma regulatory factor